MPNGLADYGATAWVGALLQVTPLPNSYYIALCTAEPGPGMDGDILVDIEPADTAYVRQRYGVGAANWAVSDNYVATLNEIVYGVALADWGLITHWAMLTAPSSGELYSWGEMLSPDNAVAGSHISVPAGGIVIALTSLDSPIAI